jgi:hypothetical protein
VETDAQTLLILGGTSDMARATARLFASRGWAIQLGGRDLETLQRESADIAVRGTTPVTIHGFDVADTGAMKSFIDRLPRLPDVVVCAVGFLGEQTRAQSDLDHAATIMRANFEGPALILGLFAERFLVRGSGTIVGISSVAGDRGRASNYVYGSAKAGFSAFLSGLRNRSARHGVHVVTVKPGFVRTRMTDGMALPAALTAAPDEVAAAIWGAVAHKKNQIYVRPIWMLIMAVIRAIPESIFKRLSI